VDNSAVTHLLIPGSAA